MILGQPAFSPARPFGAIVPRRALPALFAYAALFLAMSAFYGFTFNPRPPGDPGLVGDENTRRDVLNMAGWIALYGLSGALAAWTILRRGLDLRLLALAPFALYVLASSAWSYEPARSLVFCVMLVANIVVAHALASQVAPTLLLHCFARLTACLIAISLVLLATVPLAVLGEPTRPGLLMPGEFFGVFGHKVHMGLHAASALLVLLFDPGAIPSRTWRALAAIVCVAGLLLANSASAIVALAAAIGVVTIVRAAPALRGVVMPALALVVTAIAFLLPHLDVGGLATLAGRDPNLTGRGDLWHAAPDYIFERPWFGYGYGGFFDRDPYSAVWDLWARAQYFFTPNFHNTVIDIWINLGAVGLVFYAVILAGALLVYRNRSMGPAADLLTCVLILYVASSATDYQFLRHNSFPTVILFYAWFVAGRRYGAPGAHAS